MADLRRSPGIPCFQCVISEQRGFAKCPQHLQFQRPVHKGLLTKIPCVHGDRGLLDPWAGDCQVPVIRKLKCGHLVNVPCSSAISLCPIMKYVTLPCGHKVTHACGTEPPACSGKVVKKFPCGHRFDIVCSRIEEARCWYCSPMSKEFMKPKKSVGPTPEKLTKKSIDLDCGHYVILQPGEKLKPCRRKVMKVTLCCQTEFFGRCGDRNEPCPFIKSEELPCGHVVTFHDGQPVPACEKTLKKIQPCSHVTTYRCGTECPRCLEIIILTRQCGHSVKVHCGQPILDAPCDFTCRKKCQLGHPCSQPHPCNRPCPPCQVMSCFLFGNCTHRIDVPCFRKDEEVFRSCRKDCERKRKCGHRCLINCGDHHGQHCPPCQIPVEKERFCGHNMIVPCETNVNEEKCRLEINVKKNSACSHNIRLACYIAESLDDGEGILYCKGKCSFFFDQRKSGCGHFCPGICKTCAEDRFHEQCRQKCQKDLICGHECTSRCSSVCLPCPKKCNKQCPHGPCDHMCSTPCTPCREPCVYECPHGKCSRQCFEVCDKPPCMIFCPKILKCGHLCVGFCGEICPPLCVVCDTEELLRGCFLGNDSIDTTDRFIFLPDCGHSVEALSLEKVVTVTVVDGEIVPKRCPICRAVIRSRLHRFSKELSKISQDMETVKKQIFGDPKDITEHKHEIVEAFVAISVLKTFANVLPGFDTLESRFRENAFDVNCDNTTRPVTVKEMNIHESQTLTCVGKILSRSFQLWKKSGENVPQHCASDLHESLASIFKFLTGRPWPLTRFELISLSHEWNRCLTMESLLSKLDPAQPATLKNLLALPRGQRAFSNAYEAVNRVGPYDEIAQQKFAVALEELENALESKVKISESERLDILQAFNFSTGRWFRCPEGHVYVITECGGAMEEGVCNECGSKIGGMNHSVLPSNELATDMDGAQRPLYPTALMHRERN